MVYCVDMFRANSQTEMSHFYARKLAYHIGGHTSLVVPWTKNEQQQQQMRQNIKQ